MISRDELVQSLTQLGINERGIDDIISDVDKGKAASDCMTSAMAAAGCRYMAAIPRCLLVGCLACCL